MTTAIENPNYNLWFDDDAHWLKSRGVLGLEAGHTPALQGLVTASLAGLADGCVFALVLGDDAKIVADLFIVKSEGDLLVDCAREDLPALQQRLADAGIPTRDVTGEWRVFAELPNQSIPVESFPFLRVADPRRRELGARIYRLAGASESSAWQHEKRYLAHAHKLGVPPQSSRLRELAVDPLEAHFDVLGALDPQRVPDDLRTRLSEGAQPLRRLLPFRVEPTDMALAPMDGLPILAGESTVGTVVTREGLFGIALVDIAAFRSAVEERTPICCASDPVQITWPTWNALAGQGRAGPAAR